MSSATTIQVPASKSLTQRALVVAALARGDTSLRAPLECDDSAALRGALRALGTSIDDSGGDWLIRGAPEALRAPAGEALWCGDGGTTVRFLAPLSLIVDGPLELDGSPMLRARPLDDLVRALEQLGVSAEETPPHDGGSLPLRLVRRGAAGSHATVAADRSSQFASGLLLVAPCLPAGLQLELGGTLVSRPYLELTLATMAAFGVKVTRAGPEGRLLTVPHAHYRPRELRIEGDWSSGAFMLVARWLGGRGEGVELANLDPRSAQADSAIVAMLDQLRRDDHAGAPLRFDLGDCPDLLPPLAVACAFSGRPAMIVNAAHARIKESDRIAVLARGMNRAGIAVRELADGLEVEPAQQLRPATLETAGDHRMAMAFGLLNLREPGIAVDDPQCVSKSYPRFWRDLELVR